MEAHIDWGEEPVPDLSGFESHEDARANFEWNISDTYNISTSIVTRHAERIGDRVALHEVHGDGSVKAYTFQDLEVMSNRLANGLRDLGIGVGDRVCIDAFQRLETAITHLAVYKAGAVVVPLSRLFGPDAIYDRLSNCRPKAILSEPEVFDPVVEAATRIDAVEHLVGIDDHPPETGGLETHSFEDLLGGPSFEAVETAPTDPAMILYTSGTTGDPKGALHGHQYDPGFLPAFQMYMELFWHEDYDPVFHTPADWAWAGGLTNGLIAPWHYGFPVVASTESKWEPEVTLEIVEEFDVTQCFLAPTMINKLGQSDHSAYDTGSIVAIATGGEPVSTDVHRLVDDLFEGANTLEKYGMTEQCVPMSNCSFWFDPQPESMGKPVPGADVHIIDDEGVDQPVGETGLFAVERNPGTFLEYWDNETETDRAFVDDLFVPRDQVTRDDDGYYWFVSRSDDIIISSGYKIAPAAVEATLVEHEAVANTGVIGVDHQARGQIPKAYIVLTDDHVASAALKSDIQNFVKDHLAKHEYPRAIEFIDELPTTATGKVRRQSLVEREEGGR